MKDTEKEWQRWRGKNQERVTKEKETEPREG